MADREVIRTTVNGRPMEIRLRHRRIRDPETRQVYRYTNWEAWDQGKRITHGSHVEYSPTEDLLPMIKDMVAESM